MKSCSMPLVIKEAQIKTTMRHHFSHPLKRLLLKKKNSVGQEHLWRNWSFCAWVAGMYNGISADENSLGVPQKLNLGLPFVPATPSWVYTQRK